MATNLRTWSDIVPVDRCDEFELVERYMIQKGDIVWSSHYGERRVFDRDARGMVVELRFEIQPSIIRNEIYDRDTCIPRKKVAS